MRRSSVGEVSLWLEKVLVPDALHAVSTKDLWDECQQRFGDEGGVPEWSNSRLTREIRRIYKLEPATQLGKSRGRGWREWRMRPQDEIDGVGVCSICDQRRPLFDPGDGSDGICEDCAASGGNGLKRLGAVPYTDQRLNDTHLLRELDSRIDHWNQVVAELRPEQPSHTRNLLRASAARMVRDGLVKLRFARPDMILGPTHVPMLGGAAMFVKLFEGSMLGGLDPDDPASLDSPTRLHPDALDSIDWHVRLRDIQRMVNEFHEQARERVKPRLRDRLAEIWQAPLPSRIFRKRS